MGQGGVSEVGWQVASLPLLPRSDRDPATAIATTTQVYPQLLHEASKRDPHSPLLVTGILLLLLLLGCTCQLLYEAGRRR